MDPASEGSLTRGADPPANLRAAPAVWDFARGLLVAVPPLSVAVWMASDGEATTATWVVLSTAAALSLVFALRVQSALARRLRTVASVLASYREGDFSVRARATRRDALLDDVRAELNRLGDTLREQRLGEMEAWTLLRKVMAEVDVVVLAFDEDGRLRLANDAAAKVLGKPSATLLGRTAADLDLAELLQGDAPRVVRDSGAFADGPWELRRGSFRLSGKPHSLIVLSDVSGALREQEREAWKRLIRVMGHEINNSLAPIRSISESLLGVLAQSSKDSDWEKDMASGLAVVGRRADALSRFMTAYARLARLPAPTLKPMDVAEWVRRTVKLEQRLGVEISGGPEVTFLGDADQLDQLLINLLKNAAEATLESGGAAVKVRWSVVDRELHLVVEDEGPGVSDTANLFVPFYTTKAGGSGIGLALGRQIAEAHGGELSLRTRVDHPGAEAVITLPLRG